MGLFDRCTNIWTFLAIFCVCYMLEAILGTYLNLSMVSIERQFGIPSSVSGTLSSSGRIGYMVTVIGLAYIGSQGNRAKYISAGMLTIVCACGIIAAPHFIFSKNDKPPEDGIMMGRLNDTDISYYRNQKSFSAANFSFFDIANQSALKLTPKEVKDIRESALSSLSYCHPTYNKVRSTIRDFRCSVESTNTAALGMVFAGIILIGVGHSMPHTLGTPLIDDHVKRKNTPLFFAGISFVRVLGPLIGSFLGSGCLRLYYTLDAPVGMTNKDPRWIGAWWIGYVVVGVTLVFPSILMFLFPTDKLPTADEQEQKHLKDMDKTNGEAVVPLIVKNGNSTPEHQHHNRKTSQKILHEISKFLVSLIIILKSPIYTGMLIGRLFDAFASRGGHVFMAKYIDNHYGMPAHESSMILGPISIVSVMSGLVCGAVVMRRFKLEGRKAASFLIISSLLGGSIAAIRLGLGCHSDVSAVGQLGKATNYTYLESCNSGCNCESVGLSPVCDVGGNVYYSPCHAGCRTILKGPSKYSMNITDCSCTKVGSSVSRDYCKNDCRTPLIIFIGLNVIGALIGGIGWIPSAILGLRSVPHEHRSIALAFGGFVTTILSTFPSPIVFGRLIDKTCLKWRETCGKPQNCEIYDPQALRYNVFLFMALMRFVSIIFDVFVFYHAKNVKLLQKSVSTAVANDPFALQASKDKKLKLIIDDDIDKRIRAVSIQSFREDNDDLAT